MSSWEEREMKSFELAMSVAKTAVIGFFATIVILCVQNNSAWYNSFNKCIEAGGVPGEFPIPGVDSPRFMCLPSTSPIIGGK